MKNVLDKPRMTVAERTELARWIRSRSKVKKTSAEAVIAERMAEYTAQVAAVYDAEDTHWRELSLEASARIEQLDKELAKRCEQLGVLPKFRPRLELDWRSRGENASKQRRAELLGVAKAEVEAQVLRAHAQIEREECELIGKIVRDGLETQKAIAFFESLPGIDELIPRLPLSNFEAKVDKAIQRRLEQRRLLGYTGPDDD
jgi:hypothetical protein